MKTKNPGQQPSYNGGVLIDQQYDRILITQSGIATGLFGLNANGLAVLQTTSGGADVRYATDPQMTFNSLRDTFKIVKTGSLTVPEVIADTNVGGIFTSSVTDSYDSTLGSPIVLAFVNAENVADKKKPTVASDDSSIGTVAWNNPTNVPLEFPSYADVEPGALYDTGFLNPASTGGIYNTWTNPTNAYTLNTVYASNTVNATVKKQDFYNFNFNLPTGAVPVRIDIVTTGHTTGADAGVMAYEVASNGTSILTGSSFSSFNNQTIHNLTDGSITSTTNVADILSIGTGITRSVINDNTTSGISIIAFSQNLDVTTQSYIDEIKVKIYYVLDTISDTDVRIIRSDGTYGVENLATSSALPTGISSANTLYGGSNNLLGEVWTPADVNSANFGCAVSYTGSYSTSVSHYLKANTYGFAIPTDATITGIQVDVHAYQDDYASGTGLPTGFVDHMRISVYYSSNGVSNLWQSKESFYSPDTSGITLVPQGELERKATAVNGTLTLEAKATFATISQGDRVFGSWLVKYFVLQQTVL